jgi:auxin-responsive protein IAA
MFLLLSNVDVYFKDAHLCINCGVTGKSNSCKTSTRDMLADGSRADALQDQEYVLTYEDKDADWMLVGDLPWE